MNVFEQIETVFLDMLQPDWYTQVDSPTISVGDYHSFQNLSRNYQEGDQVFVYRSTDMREAETTSLLREDSPAKALQEAAATYHTQLDMASLEQLTLPVIYKTFGKIVETENFDYVLEIEKVEEIPLRYTENGMEITSYQEAIHSAEAAIQVQQNALDATNNNEVQEEMPPLEENTLTEELPQEEQSLEEDEPFLDIDYAARGRKKMKNELLERQNHAFHSPKENYTPPSFQLHRPPNYKEKSRHSNSFKQEKAPNPKMEQLLMEKELLQHLMSEDNEKAAQQQAFTAPEKETSSLEKLDNYTLDLELEPDNFDREEPELEFDSDKENDDKEQEQDMNLSQGF